MFTSINESTWEHMKLFVVSAFLTTVFYLVPYEGFAGEGLFFSAIAAAISAMVIPLLYYGYRMFFKYPVMMFDIAIYFLASLVFKIAYEHIVSWRLPIPIMSIAMFGILLWSIIWIILSYWTYSPPKNSLFKCPQTGIYGHPQPVKKRKRAKTHIV